MVKMLKICLFSESTIELCKASSLDVNVTEHLNLKCFTQNILYFKKKIKELNFMNIKKPLKGAHH